jgi:hypothetical protein
VLRLAVHLTEVTANADRLLNVNSLQADILSFAVNGTRLPYTTIAYFPLLVKPPPYLSLGEFQALHNKGTFGSKVAFTEEFGL